MRRLARWVQDISHHLALPDDIAFRLDLCLEDAADENNSAGGSVGPTALVLPAQWLAESHRFGGVLDRNIRTL